MLPRQMVFSFIMLLVAMAARGGEEDYRWWPTQALPKAIVRTVPWQQFQPSVEASSMMIYSIAGLAAKAVNEGRGDELVWVASTDTGTEKWLRRWLVQHPQIEDRGMFQPWELVDRYVHKGLIKGYILYRQDQSPGQVNQPRTNVDYSINVATSMASLLDGLVVEEKLEKQVQSHGLKLLLDVREKSQQWCFDTYKNQFNRHMLCTQDPQNPQVRDVAIAQRVLTVCGQDEPVPSAMKWLEPPAPILGWNGGGDEFRNTRLSSIWGHFQTATDWCTNLTVLMAGSHQEHSLVAQPLDPHTIDFQDRRSAVSFVCTDGDNVQWYEGSFFRGNDYWGCPDRGRISFGWSCCFDHLFQLCPQAKDDVLETRTKNDWFVEWGGGYYYPDLFASERPNRWELLALHARRTWALMQKTGTRIIGFNVKKIDSPNALKAYEVFAHETTGLLAIFVFQYNPYEAGAGKTFWVKDRKGVEVPVISARYSIWEHMSKRPRSGTPAKIAREICDTVSATPSAELPRYDWAIDHVWSYFRKTPGTDEKAEDLPKLDKSDKKSAHREQIKQGVRGYMPVEWCAERLPENIRVVSPEELVWRIRMKHDPVQTQKLIQSWGNSY